ncbi:hypothetical protein BCT47_21655 [Vibrio splendidus]|uniref:Chromosome partition protein Smc n=1 Tax=Vibrio splendidus TaxID=29497 RepID=A0AB35N3S5_VIBSP|nr:hypothetical protein [Vibrio splendidus]MDP2502895.1 hypothetical protein [Vibrio splendidus]PMM74399.1 hypothetical protein BCT47_21655 [Vibrio splendidus]PTO83291.1 hypothetical protein CWN93_08695 [Vibrio splendidus]
MKGLITSLSQSFVNRARNPIIGAFVLAWIGFNHKIVIEFIFSKSAEKVAFVNSLRFDWISDFWYPAGIAALYVFGLPLVQLVVDKLKRKFIDKYRLDELHTKKQSEAERDKTTNRSIVESSIDYFHKRHERNLDDWDVQREKLKEEIDGKQQDLDSVRANVANLTKEVSDKQDEITAVRKQFDEMNQKYSQLKSKFDELSTTARNKDVELSNALNKIQDLEMKVTSKDAQSRNDESEIEQLRDSLNASKNTLKNERDELQDLRNQDMLIEHVLKAISNPNYEFDVELWHNAMRSLPADKSGYLTQILKNYQPEILDALNQNQKYIVKRRKKSDDDENYALAG